MSLTNLSTKRQRIAELARSKRGVALSTLHHVIDLEWMKEAYRLTRKDGAPGIDGVTAADYAENLEANLLDLLERIKSGRYQAPPVRRVYIPKDGWIASAPRPSNFRGQGGAEGDCHGAGARLRAGLSSLLVRLPAGSLCSSSLTGLRTGFMSHGLRWVIDLDIEKYFDSISHSHLRSFLDRRVTDGVIRRMIDKWLKAGVLEDGLLRHATEGSPQGGVISPCLSNIFLHHVLDEWFENEVKPRLKGRSTLVRFADDAVMAFADFHDATAGPRRFGQASCSVRAHAPSRQDALRRFPQLPTRWEGPPGNGWHDVHLSRLLPRMGKVAEGQERRAASNGKEALRPRAGSGDRVVPETPASSRSPSSTPIWLRRCGATMPTTA